MSNQELMDDIVKFVNPKTYDGRDSFHCLIGEVDRKSPKVKEFIAYEWGGSVNDYGVVGAVSEAYEVDADTVLDVYETAAEEPYYCNLEAAIKAAREILLPGEASA